jgi:hypothetical protein
MRLITEAAEAVVLEAQVRQEHQLLEAQVV